MRRSFPSGLLVFTLVLTACQHAGNDQQKAGTTSQQANNRSPIPESPQSKPEPAKPEPAKLKAKKTEFGQDFSYRITGHINAIDFKEVFIGTKNQSSPVTWVNVGQSAATVEKVTIDGDDAAEFSAELIGTAEKTVNAGKNYGQVLFVFSPGIVGKHTAIAKLKLADGNGQAEEIKLQGTGVAVVNRGTLLSIGIPGSPNKGLDFGRVRVGSSSERNFKLKNTDRSKAIEILQINVSPDFALKKVSITNTLTYNAPVRSFKIPKGATADITLEMKPPPGFQGNERKFMGSVEFRSNGETAAGTALCGVGYHPTAKPVPLKCYE